MNKVEYFRRLFQEEYESGRYDEAIELGKLLLTELVNNNCGGTEGYINDTFNLALAYENTGDLQSAAEAFRSTVWHSGNIDSESMMFIRCLTSYAVLLGKLGAHEAAFYMHAKVCEICSRNLGSQHSVFADGLYNLANAANEIDMPDSAMYYHQMALGIRENSDNISDIINSLHSIAFLHEESNSMEMACEYARRAMCYAVDASDIDVYPSACIYLAELYAKCEKYADAIEIYDSAMLEIRTQFGREHSSYLNTAFSRAMLLGKEGRYEEAEVAFSEIIDTFENHFGTHHLFYSNCCKNLAVVYERMGMLMESKGAMLEAVSVRRRFGKCMPSDFISIMRLALMLDNYDEAIFTLVYVIMLSDSVPWADSQSRNMVMQLLSKLPEDTLEPLLQRMANVGGCKGACESLVLHWLKWEKHSEPGYLRTCQNEGDE